MHFPSKFKNLNISAQPHETLQIVFLVAFFLKDVIAFFLKDVIKRHHSHEKVRKSDTGSFVSVASGMQK